MAGGLAAARIGLFGADDPEVGDCAQPQGAERFEVVDCDSAEAQFTIVGKDGAKRSYEEFQADDSVCASFATAERALWTEDGVGGDGTTWCAVPVG